MLSKSIIIILSILALALSVSSRPYANTTLATRQTNSTRPLATRQILGAGNGGGTQGAGNGGQSIGSLDLNSGDITGGVTIEQAIKMCGKAQLECCRKDSTTDDTLDGGSIGAFFGSGDFDIQCNPIEFPIIAGRNNPPHSLPI